MFKMFNRIETWELLFSRGRTPQRTVATATCRGHTGDTITCFLLFLERHPFTAVTRVQIPSGTPSIFKQLRQIRPSASRHTVGTPILAFGRIMLTIAPSELTSLIQWEEDALDIGRRMNFTVSAQQQERRNNAIAKGRCSVVC